MAEAKAKPVNGRRKGSQPPPEADKPPRKRRQQGGASKRRQKVAKELGQIESAFTELLTFPAMPAAAAGDAWLADHFTERGPALASRLVAECERNERLRETCLKLIQGQSILLLGFEGFMYGAPVLMHFGIMPGAEQLGVPVVRRGGPESKRQGPSRARWEAESDASKARETADDIAEDEDALWQQDEPGAPVRQAPRSGEAPIPPEPPVEAV